MRKMEYPGLKKEDWKTATRLLKVLYAEFPNTLAAKEIVSKCGKKNITQQAVNRCLYGIGKMVKKVEDENPKKKHRPLWMCNLKEEEAGLLLAEEDDDDEDDDEESEEEKGMADQYLRQKKT
jgi:hypothetical protein